MAISNFELRVKDLEKRSKHAGELALTEEATKTSVVMPFLQVLGYDVFNLEEVIPEFVADVGIKKGEKIDFAIKIDGKISILVEVKPISMSLGNAQFSQLYRYFAALDAKLAVLTNGREVWFFSDTEEKNKMDKRPFFVFDFQSFDDHQVKELSRFQKDLFNIESILEAASNLKFVKAAASFVKAQLTAPTDEFVRLIAKSFYEGTFTKSVIEQLRPAIQASLDEVIRERIQDKLNVTFSQPIHEANAPRQEIDSKEDGVETTEEELQAFMIVRAIGARVTSVERITMRDAKSYCSIFVDDKNNRPVCRFYFNAKSVKRIGVFDAEKNETKHDLNGLSDIYKFSSQIETAIKTYI
jgi:hypothetical protein